MIELSLRFTSDEKIENSPIQVSLFRPDAGISSPPLAFTPPMDDPELRALRWYLELYAGWPMGEDKVRAERIEADLEDWGRALLDSVLQGKDAPRLWQQFVDAEDKGKLLTLDATDPRVLRLPWELLADESGHLFSQGVGVRRRLQKATAKEPKALPLPVHILLVVSRPDGVSFLDPRSDARALMDAVDELGKRVKVEFLYPPTVDALSKRLRDRKAPPVHIVHFDGHGVYDARLGLGYLLFEDDQHKEDQADALRLGNLLNQCGVSLMLLSACQSGKQEETNPYASVAARLIRSGVGSVLAMNYSVLVSATRLFVEAFYGALVDASSVGRAVDEGRFELLSNEKRGVLIAPNAKGDLVETTLHLRDWFLPALYQQAADPILFKADGMEAGEPVAWPQALVDPGVPGGLPGEPRHGFHGRARELLKLERAFAEHRIVVLQGFGGLGKTALAAEAGRWFYRTGRFPGAAAFVSFEHGGSLQQLCSWVGQAVSGDPSFNLGDGDSVAAIGKLLAERPSLVILDNFESVLGKDPQMPTEELRVILDAVWAWAGGAKGKGDGAAGSRVLITTRDTTIADDRFAPSQACAQLGLEGLAMPDALDLAAAVLDAHGIDRSTVGRQALVDLMDRLGGHPLSLYLVLPRLKEMSAAEITARFEELLPGFTTGAAKERNESLAVSLEFSLHRLGEATRAALPDLGVFQGGAFEYGLLEITGIEPGLWGEARAELEGAALVTVERIQNVTPPFLRFHPTLAPYLAGQLSPDRRSELEARYWRRYYGLANYLYQADGRTPHEARAIALRELPNLRRAFDLCLKAGEAEAAVNFADRIARFLNIFGRRRERDALFARLERLELAAGEGLTRAENVRLSLRGETLLDQGRAVEAEQVFRELLARMEAGIAYGGDDAAYDRARTLDSLGRCLEAQGRAGQASEVFRQALAGFQALAPSDEAARRQVGTAYSNLGDCLTSLGRFAEARQAYENALGIDKDLGDRRGEAVDLGQLGSLALAQGNLAEARARHQEALSAFHALGEPQTEATAWHQLGRVAQEAEDWEEAERCYRESLKIEERLGNQHGVAQTCNQLAIVAQTRGRPGDAERWYMRAQKIKDEVSPQNASTLNNLASLYLSQDRLEEAERYARQAAEIQEALADPSTEPWKTYSILAQIAQAQGRADKAADWRRKEYDARDAYAGTQHELASILQKFKPVIEAVVTATGGDAAARVQVEDRFDTFRQGNWQIGGAIRRIWAGERDAEALTAGIDYGSRAVVLAILARLSGEPPTSAPATASDQPHAPQTPPSADPVQRIRQQWAPVVGAVVAACQGNEQAAQELAPFLDDMAQQDDWRNLVAVLRRILAGERDPQALLPGLDDTDTVIVGDVLQGLGVDVGDSPTSDENGEPEGITLEQLIDLVGVASQLGAPAGMGEQLFALTRQLSNDPNAPEELHALGRVLNRVLAGDRKPDLTGLPPALTARVQEMLAGLK